MSNTPAPNDMQVNNETPSRAARPIMITTAVIGGLALFSVGSSAALAAVVSGVNANSQGISNTAVAVDGITGLDIDSSAAKFNLAYGEVQEATLDVTGPRSSEWSLTRDGDELKVRSPRGIFGGIGFCFMGCSPDLQTVTLTLPRELEDRALDVDASLGAGELVADGKFRDFDLDMSAGRTTLAGSARSLDVDMSAGSFDGELSGVQEASFNISAGSAKAELTGVTPREIDIEVSAGSVELRLPDDSYRVDTDVSAGSVDNKLSTDPTSRNLITADVSAGKVTLRPGK